jgi:hypothetical protein
MTTFLLLVAASGFVVVTVGALIMLVGYLATD